MTEHWPGRGGSPEQDQPDRDQPDQDQPDADPRGDDGPEAVAARDGRAEPGEMPAEGRLLQRLITVAIVAAGFAAAVVFYRDALSSGLLFLLILLGLVMAHEAGHFLTAKAFGVQVHEFGLGFPPRIAAFRYGETEYSVNWLPIGGFVRLEGEEHGDHPRALGARPRWQRLIVLTSGAVVNLLLPVFLFAAALSWPHEVPIGRAEITELVPGAPAEGAGFLVGDVIYEVNGRDATNIPLAARYIRLSVGREIDIRLRREGEFITLGVLARRSPPAGQGPTGIAIASEVVAPDGRAFTEREALPPWESIPQGVRETWDTMILARNEIISWFGGSASPQFAGPVGIGQTVGEVARQQETASAAVSPLLQIAALLSINLGVLNLLPLPMLDGGRVLFLLIEVVRRGRRIAPEKEAFVHMIGFVVFLSLALVITFFDISRIASGESLFR